MNRLLILVVVCLLSTSVYASKSKKIAPGVISVTEGRAERLSPLKLMEVEPRFDNMERLSTTPLPFSISDIKIEKNSRGVRIRIPLSKEEEIYGFGMQINTFGQRGLKRKPIVNDQHINTIGYTHAPQPFYVSTDGYGVLINTSRYVTFHCGSNAEYSAVSQYKRVDNSIKLTTDELYQNKADNDYAMWIDVPNVDGVEVLIFTGKDLKECVQRYNLFSGGGAIPPLWGLGVKYRVKGTFDEKQIFDMASYWRDNDLPCDVLGLEPGWHTNAYSCSFVWSDKFPQPKQMIESLRRDNFRVNLWEHAYIHPTAPFFEQMKPYAGDFLVWDGLVPDFTQKEVVQIFKEYHEKNLLTKGVSSFKLDESDCGNIADANSTWGFPEMSRFPSGLDGEQMRQLYGQLYVKLMTDMYKERNQRTWFDYRAGYMFSSNVPAVLYSDIYDHECYIRMISTASFGGLLWSPELRDSRSDMDMIRRLQTVLLSPQALINAWFLSHVPWFQINQDLNNQDVCAENFKELETNVRVLLKQRMSLVPYLYSAFMEYNTQGTPPFRALVMDYSQDVKCRNIDNQYLVGASLMATPTTADKSTREVYFPENTIWYDLYSGEKYVGGESYNIAIATDRLPLFVKDGSIIPLATPTNYINQNTQFDITCNVFGEQPSTFTLYEDDGETFDYQSGKVNRVRLSFDGRVGTHNIDGDYSGRRYNINNWSYKKTGK